MASGIPNNIQGKRYINGVDTAPELNPAGLAVTGFSSVPTSLVYVTKRGNLVFVEVEIEGTSNATTFTITGLPYGTTRDINQPCLVTDNGTNATGLMQMTSGSTTISFYTTPAGGAFTASGDKKAFISFFYVTTNP